MCTQNSGALCGAFVEPFSSKRLKYIFHIYISMPFKDKENQRKCNRLYMQKKRGKLVDRVVEPYVEPYVEPSVFLIWNSNLRKVNDQFLSIYPIYAMKTEWNKIIAPVLKQIRKQKVKVIRKVKVTKFSK